MQLAVIIAEYNPFHNGHAHHIAYTKAAGATHIAVVMSGNFVQRGGPAFLEKRVRAKAALASGADLILELPLPYAMSAAEHFAYGGVALANALGCAKWLSFGCETADLELFDRAVQFLDTPQLAEALTVPLQQGLTFAAARDTALRKLGQPALADLLRHPNNTLAVAYLQQLKNQAANLQPLPVPRKGADHDSTAAVQAMASASLLRQMKAWEDRIPYMPQKAFEICSGALEIDPVRLEGAVLARLRTLQESDFSALPDCSEGIENRFYHAVRKGRSIQEILELAKTKRYTMARLRRLLYSAFIGIEKGLCQAPPPYLRILGANAGGLEVLSQMKHTAKLPISHSLLQLQRQGTTAEAFALLEARAADLYQSCLTKPGPCGLDYTDGPIWMKA